MTAYSALIGSGILAAFVDFRVHSGRSVSDWAIMAWSHRGTVALRLARARIARPGPPTGGPVRSDFFGTRDPPTLALPESVIGRRHGVPRRRPGTRDAGDRRRCGPAPGLLPSAATERTPPGGDRRGSCPSDGARAALVAGPPGGDQRRGGLVLARALGGIVATAPPARRAHESFLCHLDQRARWAAAPLRTRSECGQRAGLSVPSGHTNKTTVQSDQGLRESAIDKIPSLDSHVPISLGVLSHHAWFAPNATVQQSDSASA